MLQIVERKGKTKAAAQQPNTGTAKTEAKIRPKLNHVTNICKRLYVELVRMQMTTIFKSRPKIIRLTFLRQHKYYPFIHIIRSTSDLHVLAASFTRIIFSVSFR